jgi:phage repressor protein C with HTH and peptisase S24 domain
MIYSVTLCNTPGVADDYDLGNAGDRLKWARARAGYADAADFARAARINPTTYRAYENNQNGFSKHAPAFAKLLGVTTDWLLAGGDVPTGAAPARAELVTVPDQQGGDTETAEIIQLDLSLPMGPGATVDDYIEEDPRTFDLAYIRGFTRTPPHRLRIARGVGDSMFPTLQSADEVWIDSTQRTLNLSDKIWAVSINGGAAIKRLRPLRGGKVLVMSDNKTIGDYEVDADELLIGGRVIRFARDL